MGAADSRKASIKVFTRALFQEKKKSRSSELLRAPAAAACAQPRRHPELLRPTPASTAPSSFQCTRTGGSPLPDPSCNVRALPPRSAAASTHPDRLSSRNIILSLCSSPAQPVSLPARACVIVIISNMNYMHARYKTNAAKGNRTLHVG